ncbi:peroxiredoxin-like family protein [Armatimonas sp.]|uniref:peroxiredoxin-like family protein n=1 Tax=Armatimonas sp. TaxID=1872638 RepID=UPI00286A1DBA|nr:peroxiredoxin-like family protein [Armatimonas sp.]
MQCPLLDTRTLEAQAQTGETLGALSERAPTMLVFTRHFGCPFCRQMLTILATRRAGIEATGVQLALVHMGSEAQAAAFFASYGLGDLPRFADPKKKLYAAFGLKRMRLTELFRPSFWTKGIAMTRQSSIGLPVGDVFQFAGAFVIFQGRIVQAIRTTRYSEIPELPKSPDR